MKIKTTLAGLMCLLLFNACSTSRIELDASTKNKCLAVLREGLASDQFWPSIHAAEALTLAGHGAEVRRHLEPKLKTEKDDQKRCGLSRELVRAGAKPKSAVMLGILKGADTHGHVHAAESLYKVGWMGDAAPLRAAFAQTGNMTLRLMAAGALVKHERDAKALAFLRDRMRAEKDPEVFRIVAWLLGRIGGKADIGLIRARMKDAPNANVKAYLNNAMAALGDTAGQAALVSNLTSGDPGLRVYAAVFAGEAGMTAVKLQLIALLKDDTLDVRIRAAQSLLVLSR
jgi:sialidase-1